MANVQLKPLRSSKTRTNYVSPINPETRPRIKSATKNIKKGPINKIGKDKQQKKQQEPILATDNNTEDDIKFINLDTTQNTECEERTETTNEINVTEILKDAQEKNTEKVFEIELRSRSIKYIRNLDAFVKVRLIDLSNNRIENIENLDKNTAVCYLPNLEDLRVTHNNLKNIPELCRCSKLQEVDLSDNKISDLSRLKGSSKLQRNLKKLASLVELNVQCNPCTKENNYITSLQNEIETLHILDGVHFTKTNNTASMPYFRPLSAATSVISSKQIESQLKTLESDISEFEKYLSNNMTSFWEKMSQLPSSPQENQSPPPTSRSSQRSRLAEARQFAAEHFKER
ncbi:DgyrCDS305 [Dimorphilus gyrociliatus]|uniref:DgyrCDS305 n=1 Tax=Dimorphilus gyrociliatus TaxID=2664684 RepID=A0A7I8V6Q8_9ANNE|nr:DgyrCDS305 [Dimorphilus gyrociliatus]